MKKHFQILKPSPLKDGDSTLCRTNYLIAAFSFFIFNSALTASAQFNTLWTYTVNPSIQNDAAYAVTADASGVYIAGTALKNVASEWWLIEKRDLNTGAIIWTQNNCCANSPKETYAITADASGIYAAGSWNPSGSRRWRIEKRDLTTGALIATFGSPNGYVTSNPGPNDDNIYAITADANAIYVAGSTGDGMATDFWWCIEKRDKTTGALDVSFGTAGLVTSNPIVGGVDIAYAITSDASGIYVAGYDNTPGNAQWRIEKRDLTTGALIATFGSPNGYVTSNPGASNVDYARSITVDANAIYVAGSDGNVGGGQWRIEKRDKTTGVLDAAFDGDGVVTSNPGAFNDIAYSIVADASEIYVAGTRSFGASGRMEKRNKTTGALLCFVDEPEDYLYAITADASGIYAAGMEWVSGDNRWWTKKYDLCGPLPIELLSFTATAYNGNSVLCNWQTAAEINNDYFTLEKSTDAINFSPFVTIDGAGNSSQTISYQYTDKEPYMGLSYYRLKQTDFNGTFSYSNIESVFFGGINIISIFPNPSSDYIQYTVGSETGGVVTVRLYDALGREVMSKEETIEAGVTEKKIETSRFGGTSGNYLLRITNGNLERTQKQFLIK